MGERPVKRAWWGWPGDLLCVNGLGVRTACWLSSQVPVSCRRAAVGQAGAPAAVAPVRARARTNELDAGKRRPMIGGEEEPAGLWLRGRGVSLGGSPGACAGPAEWSHIH